MKTVGPSIDTELVVHDRRHIADDVVALELRNPDGGALPAWSPGAHVDLVLAGGVVRQYSLCGDQSESDAWTIAVLHEERGRGGSRLVHALQRNETVHVRGPRNHFPLEPAGSYLFLAGGIGITPILPMLAAATDADADWRLVYGGRTATSMAFARELRVAHGARVDLRPADRYGLLELDALLDQPRPDTLIYCCGPTPLIDAVERGCASWAPGTLHTERFQAVESADADSSFEVQIASTGAVLTVPPGRSVLEVAEDAGIEILSSCRAGTCGTCETGVLEGRVDHRDTLLDPDERAANDTMFICVSRATSPRLVLDL